MNSFYNARTATTTARNIETNCPMTTARAEKIVCNAHATIAHASIARCDIFVCACVLCAVCSTTEHITRLQNNNNTKKYVRSGRAHSFWRSLFLSIHRSVQDSTKRFYFAHTVRRIPFFLLLLPLSQSQRFISVVFFRLRFPFCKFTFKQIEPRN